LEGLEERGKRRREEVHGGCRLVCWGCCVRRKGVDGESE
jgi:hypothetical protein